MLSRAQNTFHHNPRLRGPVSSIVKMHVVVKLYCHYPFVYAYMVPSWADQLLPQLLIEQFDNLPLQCRQTWGNRNQ